MSLQLTCSRMIAGVVVLSAGVLASAAHAAPVVNFDVTVSGATGGPSNALWSQVGTPSGSNPGEHFFSSGQGTNPLGGPLLGPPNAGGNEWSVAWGFIGDDNPDGAARLGSSFTVTNNHTNNLQFSILFEMDVIPASNTSFFGNATINILMPDGGGLITAHNGPILNYYLNGAAVASLFPHGYDQGGNGAGTLANSGSLVTPVNQVAALAGTVPFSLGILIEFDLTPGSTVEFTGVWGYIPAPGCLSVLALAAVSRRSRRRDN